MGDFLVSTHQPLTNPLDALLLPRVLRWVTVVFRQKSRCGHLDPDGRPWSRVPAKDLVAQLEREEGLEVTTRRVQRSLCRLVDAGYLSRQQRTKWWGQRDFWYSWTDEEWALQQHRPTAVARSSSVSSESVANRRPEASAASGQVLGSPLQNQHSLRQERKVAARLDGVSACAAPQLGSAGANHPTGRSRSNTPLQGLVRVVQRATARGFASASPSLVTPDPQTLLETWEESGFRFTRLASGLVVKDSLLTAPVR